MKIKTITKSTEKTPTYDMEVATTHNYYIKCGSEQLVSHNSSVIQCSTNGVEPPMEPLVYKSSKSNRLPVLVPNVAKWKNRYTYAFTFDNKHIIELYSLMQKFIDMSISMNHYYDFSQYPDNKLPDSVVIGDMLLSYKLGLCSMYYAKTRGIKDDSVEKEEDKYASCTIGGGCTL